MKSVFQKHFQNPSHAWSGFGSRGRRSLHPLGITERRNPCRMFIPAFLVVALGRIVPICLHFRARLGLASVSALAVLSLAGCVSPTVLQPGDVAKVNLTHVRAYLPQKELKAEIDRHVYGGAGGGGYSGIGALLGDMVDASTKSTRASNANVRVEQIRSVTGDLDVRTAYWQSISNAIPNSCWLKVGTFETLADDPRQPTKEELAKGAVLNIEMEYSLSADCTLFFTVARLGFYLPGTSTKPTARGLVAYYSAQIDTKPPPLLALPSSNDPFREERANAVRLWATNNGAAYRNAVSEGVQANARLIHYALEAMGGLTNVAARPAEICSRFLPYREGSSALFNLTRPQMIGKVFEETPDRLIFQARNGAFFSFPRKDVELNYIKVK